MDSLPAPPAPTRALDPAAAHLRVLGLIGGAAALLVLSLVLMASTAETPGARRFGRLPAEYLSRQVAASVLGGLVALGASALGAARLRRWAPLAALALVAACALTLVPGVGAPSGGAWRQVELGPVSVQPTILLAALVPAALGATLEPRGASLRGTWLLWTLLALGGGVCLAQPNFGHLGTLCATCMGTLWALGRPARRLLLTIGGLSLAAGAGSLAFPYVRWRLRSFLEPGLTQDTVALQRILGDAEALGLGLGQGGDKALLSAAPTDYVFAVCLEELGWLGAAGTLLLLLGVALATWRLAPPNAGPEARFARAVAGGSAAFVAFPALVHVAVCLRLFPVTGIHLPLLSYTGSGVVAVLLALGLAVGAQRAR